MIPKQTSSIVLVTDNVRHCPIVSLGCDRPLGGGPPAASGCQLPAIMLQSKIKLAKTQIVLQPWNHRTTKVHQAISDVTHTVNTHDKNGLSCSLTVTGAKDSRAHKTRLICLLSAATIFTVV